MHYRTMHTLNAYKDCIGVATHYQRVDILIILHKTMTSFYLPYPPFVEPRAALTFFEDSFQHAIFLHLYLHV